MSFGYRDDNSWMAYLTYVLTKMLLLSPQQRHFSLNSILDSIHIAGLNAYDVLTLLESGFFHALFYYLAPSFFSSPFVFAPIVVAQLSVAVWAYRSFLPYVSAEEGGKRDVYRFSLLPRPDAATSTSDEAALTNAPSSPPFYSPSSAEEGDELLSSADGLRRAESARPPVDRTWRGRISDITDAEAAGSGRAAPVLSPPPAASSPTAVSSSPPPSAAGASPSPNSRYRRLSTSETISALKRPLLHARQRKKLSAFQKLQLQSLNPFVNRTFHLSHHEHLRLSLAMAFLFPFRLFFFLLAFLCCYLHCKLCIAGVSLDSIKTQPLPAWRRQLLYPVRWYCRLLLFILGYVWIGVKGRPGAPSEAPMVVCNHVGFVEPIYLIYAFLPSPVGAVENLILPIVGVICQALQAVPVRRNDRASRGELVRTLKRRCESPDWPQIVIFPEGTTTNGQSLITFKSGAFIAGTPVQPVYMRFPSGSRVNPAWVSCGPHPLQLVLRLLAEPFSRAYVEYLPVHHPTAEEVKDANLYAANVRAEIAKAMQVPTTNHSYEDALLAEAAWSSPLFQSMPSVDRRQTTTIELSALHGLGVDIDADSALLHLRRFRTLDTRGEGRLSYDELRQGLGVKDSPEMVQLFASMDEEDTGSIDFREYLLGLAMVEKATSAGKGDKAVKDGAGDGELMREEVRMRLLCRMLDVEDSGRVQLSDLLAALSRTTTMDEEQQRRYITQLSHATEDAGKEAEKETISAASVANGAEAAAGGGGGASEATASALASAGQADGAASQAPTSRESLSFDELIDRLRSEPALYHALVDSLFSPLPSSDVAPAKAEAAEAFVQVEVKGWRKRIREGMGKVRRRFHS